MTGLGGAFPAGFLPIDESIVDGSGSFKKILDTSVKDRHFLLMSAAARCVARRVPGAVEQAQT